VNVDDLMHGEQSLRQSCLMNTAITPSADLPVDQYMTAVGQAARVAATTMAAASTAAKNNALLALAAQIRAQAGELKARNEADVMAAERHGLAAPMVDRLRLTDKVAHRLMDERGVPRAGTQQKFMPLRMQCRFLVVDGVDFVSHRGAARAALIAAVGKQPITMRVLYRLRPDGSRAWYVQASIDLPTGFKLETAASREAGVLALDFNARGVAWCAVKPDGNRLRDQHGFFAWCLKGRTDRERRQDIGTVVAQLARHAKRLKLPMAIEALDFATKKAAARAGAVNKRFNDMLGSLPSAQFSKMVQRVCEKQHLKLYSVNPLFSSVGGFTKYGRPNRMNADASAALWLGRQALYGEVWKTEGAVCHTGIFDERLVFSHLPATPMQSMTALAGAQWRDVAWGLGSNRRKWGEKLRTWHVARVEAASRSKEQPAPALSPAG